jgi:phage terminase large subunit-like protein
VRLACARHLADLARDAVGWKYCFDEREANRVCRFIEELPHTKGDWAIRAPGKDIRIRLEGWQCFVLASVFGWLNRETRLRRFRIAYVCVPRKNGKSILASGVGNHMFANDGEFGAEVYAGATCWRQAWEVFRPAKLMVERTPAFKKAFGIHPSAKNMAILANGSRFEPVVGKPGDGASPSCAIVDEYHEHKTDELVDTMRSGMGARKQPLLWIITTAGSTIFGPCHSMQRDVEQVLDGVIHREELFGVIYTIDADDDWTTEAALRKANPNFGVSVEPDFLRDEQSAAVQSARKAAVFKTKHLNVWVSASEPWMNMQLWQAAADPTLRQEDFIGCPSFHSADIASKIDIAALGNVFKKRLANGEDHYYAFVRSFLPAARALDPERQHYQEWVASGHLETTPGAVLAYEHFEREAIADIKKCKSREFAFDPWNAEQLAQNLQREISGLEIVEIGQNYRDMSEPMKQLEALLLSGRFHHDGNPALMWQVANVIAKPDAADNIKPTKHPPEAKIDAAVALIMAIARALVATGRPRSVYSTRGLLTL